MLLLLNAHHEPLPFTLPATKPEQHWERLLDTADQSEGKKALKGGEAYPLRERSLVVLLTRRPEEAGQTISATQVETLLRAKERLPQPAGS